MPVCAGGLTLTPERLHCCWPAQTWNEKTNGCVGTPTCAGGLEARFEQCLPPLRPAMTVLRGLIPFKDTAARLTDYQRDCRCSHAEVEYSVVAHEACVITVRMTYRNELCGSYYSVDRHCIAGANVSENLQQSSDGDVWIFTQNMVFDLSKLTGVHTYCQRKPKRPWCAVTPSVGMNTPPVMVGIESSQALAKAFHDVGVACGAKPKLHPPTEQ